MAREAAIEPRVLVSSDRTARHIDALVAGGMRRIEIAKAAGVSPALVTKASRPGGSLNAESEERLLGVGVVRVGESER